LSNKAIIAVNSVKVPVTTNLYSALQQLRREGIERVWVDALCINQQNTEERSHQVRRMGAIY